jgi:hypothetical protein
MGLQQPYKVIQAQGRTGNAFLSKDRVPIMTAAFSADSLFKYFAQTGVKNMKKRIQVLLTVMILSVCLLSGCAGKQDPAGAASIDRPDADGLSENKDGGNDPALFSAAGSSDEWCHQRQLGAGQGHYHLDRDTV